jgi:hypothetical protein
METLNTPPPSLAPLVATRCDPLVSSQSHGKSHTLPVGCSFRGYTNRHVKFLPAKNKNEDLHFLDMLPNLAEFRVPLNSAPIRIDS